MREIAESNMLPWKGRTVTSKALSGLMLLLFKIHRKGCVRWANLEQHGLEEAIETRFGCVQTGFCGQEQGPIQPTVGPGPDMHSGPYSKSSQKFKYL